MLRNSLIVAMSGQPNETLRLDRRVRGACLHPMLKTVGVARVPYPKDDRFTDGPPDLEVLLRLAAGLRSMGREH
jgi:hypothetical protein